MKIMIMHRIRNLLIFVILVHSFASGNPVHYSQETECRNACCAQGFAGGLCTATNECLCYLWPTSASLVDVSYYRPAPAPAAQYPTYAAPHQPQHTYFPAPPPQFYIQPQVVPQPEAQPLPQPIYPHQPPPPAIRGRPLYFHLRQV